jgi:hypothetical protein
MKLLQLVFLAALAVNAAPIHATNTSYASPAFWDGFWKNSDGWGKPNDRVMDLLAKLDGTKETITMVDVGAGNGRNSVQALQVLFDSRKPKSNYGLRCVDTSEVALQGLSALALPGWLKLTTSNLDANLLTETSLPKSDLLLLYGILEYVTDEKLAHVLDIAREALNLGGYLVIVTLVAGEGALEIENEVIRSADAYTKELTHLPGLTFVDAPTVTKRPDFHDLGKGFPEHHLHYVYRTVLVKEAGKSEL